jgi:hypothetical protein
MRIHSMRAILAGLFFAAICAASSVAAAKADEVSKEVCIDSHSRGQDARQQGKLSMARKLFMTCAQSACPSLVQDDCARYADELDRLQPVLSFSARDGAGNDLPDTAVYIDEELLMTRLDDGKPHEVDPGKHVIRFSHDGEDETVTVVVGTGEKGRTIVGTFSRIGVPNFATASGPRAVDEGPEVTHSTGSKVLVGAGTALLVTGAAMGVVGLTRVPKECSIADHHCTAPPGDASFEEAGKAIKLSNIGWSVAGAGGLALIGGIVWYVKSAHEDRQPTAEIAPVVTPESAGLVIRGRM